MLVSLGHVIPAFIAYYLFHAVVLRAFLYTGSREEVVVQPKRVALRSPIARAHIRTLI